MSHGMCHVLSVSVPTVHSAFLAPLQVLSGLNTKHYYPYPAQKIEKKTQTELQFCNQCSDVLNA